MVNVPAEVEPGDLLVAALVAPRDLGLPPKDWHSVQSVVIELWGSEGERQFTLLTHIVADGESGATVYDFSDAPAQPSSMAVLAFRGARVIQPADPATVAADTTVDGGVQVPGFTARGRTISVLFLGSANVNPTFPFAVGNLAHDELGSFVAGYHGPLVPDQSMVPTLAVPVTTMSGSVGVAILGVVEGP
jgi:hypothetical protein